MLQESSVLLGVYVNDAESGLITNIDEWLEQKEPTNWASGGTSSRFTMPGLMANVLNELW